MSEADPHAARIPAEKDATGGSSSGQSRVLPYSAVFIASVCVMTAELLASRLIARHLGQSLYTWTSCIGVFLGGIAAGNFMGGWLADRGKHRGTLCVLFMLCALTTLLSPVLNHAMASITWMWERSWPTRIFLHVTITFIAPAILLGAISPVAARMAVGKGQGEHVGRTLGILYALGALGSIVGTYLAGFWLIAHFGTVQTLTAVAAVLMLLALAVMPRSRSALVGLLLAMLITIGTASRANLPPLHALQFVQSPDHRLLYKQDSAYSLVRVNVLDEEKNQIGMHLDRLLHSQMIKGHPRRILYEYMQVYVGLTDLRCPPQSPMSALVLGGGGYVFPWYLELTRPGSRIDVVEIDPVVTEAAHIGFGFPRDTTVNSFHEDARQYLEHLVRTPGQPRYDMVYSDVVSDYGVPFHLTTIEFARLIKDVLKPDGVWAFNLIDSGATADLVTSALQTCREVFPHVRAALCAGNLEQRATFVLVCSNSPLDYKAILAKVNAHQRFGGRFITPAEEKTLRGRADPLTLTDNYAPVERMVARMLTADPELRSSEFVEAGTEAIRAGRPTEALHLFKRAAAIGSSAPIPYYNYALALYNKGQHEEAVRQLYEALNRDQYYLPAHDLAGSILSQHGHYERAGVHWEFVTRINPSYLAGWNNLANVLLILSRTDDARYCIEQAEELAPGNLVTLVLRGNLLLNEDKPSEAATAFRKALAAGHDRIEITENLATALERAGQLDEALNTYGEVLKRDPDYPPALTGAERVKAKLQNGN